MRSLLFKGFGFVRVWSVSWFFSLCASQGFSHLTGREDKSRSEARESGALVSGCLPLQVCWASRFQRAVQAGLKPGCCSGPWYLSSDPAFLHSEVPVRPLHGSLRLTLQCANKGLCFHSLLYSDWKEVTQWLVNVSWLYPILQWDRTSGERHSEPKALNPWPRERNQSATDAEEVRARPLSREISTRARPRWGRPSHFSPTQEFLAAEGVLSGQGWVSVNKPPSPGHPTPTPALSSFKGQRGGQRRGRQLCPRRSRASSSSDPQNTDKQGREGEAWHEGSWGSFEGSTGQISTKTGQGSKCPDPNSKGTNLPY